MLFCAVEELPADIASVDESVTKEIVACAHEGKCEDGCATAFRIVPQELQFYKRMNFPLPGLCPQCRHAARCRWRNPIRFWRQQCSCAGTKSENGVYDNTASHFHGDERCPNEFETSYSPEGEVIYCERCYNAEVG